MKSKFQRVAGKLKRKFVSVVDRTRTVAPWRVSIGLNQRLMASRLAQQSRTMNAGTTPSMDSAPSVSISTDVKLPKLAWRGVLADGRMSFTLGPGVERFTNGFFEGVWAGDFSTLETAMDTNCFGSGVIFREEELTVLVPSAPYEQIFVVKDHESSRLHIANSLCHVLASARVDLAGEFFAEVSRALPHRVDRITKNGAIWYDPLVAAVPSMTLYVVICNNFRIGADGTIHFQQNYSGRIFNSFEDYINYIRSAVGKIIENATNTRRAHPLAPAVTVSKRYDSPAVAAVAVEEGCKDALCMDIRSMRGKYELNDSGEDIARSLGLNIIKHDYIFGEFIKSLHFDIPTDLKEKAYEFVATAGLGDDIMLASFEESLDGRTLFTGNWGDSIWKVGSDVPPGLPIRVVYGKSLTEFRLRVGFAHVPVPMIGGFFPRSIVRISNSKGMRPFSVRRRYNRPIPRRLVEEAGVPREEFGLYKGAANPNVLNRNELWMDSVKATMARYT